eukprot:TRINITY_DN22816_c0_g1_i7.p1 TRINITY_DN22816_c0_g1~~TRINITY_DN22816_c0_g1_i7.p1  ORF type:complete len:317 (+),score=86.53 TRINITY_DN22816_c0_g1_i7:81-1031(+)
MIRRPPRSTLSSSSAASDVYKRQVRGFGLKALMVEQEEHMAILAQLREEHPASRGLVVPDDAIKWTPEELRLFFRSGGLLKPLLSPWSSGVKTVPVQPKPKPTAATEHAAPAAPVPVRRQMSPQEYAMAVQRQGHTPRPEPALIISAESEWLRQLQGANHLIPFEGLAAVDATNARRANEHWSVSSQALLARGVDVRLFYDSLSFKVLGAISFGEPACLTAEESMGKLASTVESTALSGVLQGVAGEACKLKAAPAHKLRTFTLRMTGGDIVVSMVYKVEAQVTSVLGPMVEVNAVVLDAQDQPVCELVTTYEALE